MAKSKDIDEPIEHLKPPNKQIIVDWIVSAIEFEKELGANSKLRVTGIANTLNGFEGHILGNVSFAGLFDNDVSDSEFK